MRVQSAGGVEYTDSISAREKDLPNDCYRYDTKPSESDILVLEL